ncbi:MAG: serine hydrolase domain-containing protein [Alphaproteobacteria bacterium]|nr:serine hydrolase domain-containing protein [Alphaproteobacteria bacterium]
MKRWALGLIGMTLALCTASAVAQTPATTAPAAVAASAPPIVEDASLEPFIDGVVQTTMHTERIAGVSVVVVRDGRVVLLKGYGVADEAGRRIDPERTLFRIASISKTFTWIAMMQLVEQGKVDLNKPANDYLPAQLRIPDDGQTSPVLVRHLMTHSAGFEDLVAGHLFIPDPALAAPLVNALEHHRPRRVRPPGSASVYSNYATALAGAIVQHVTGQTFEDHVETTILTPLGLQSTTFREPYPMALVQGRGLPSPMSPALAADLSEGFRWSGGAFAKQPFEFVVQFAPAGSVSTTAADMGRYLQALMAGGNGVLKPESVALFAREKPLLANAPGVNGVAWGMLQSHSPGGWRAWGHGGDTLRFHSELAIYPELKLGVFVTTNTTSGGALRDFLPGAIADRVGGANPAVTPAPAPDPEQRAALRRFAGAYMVDRRSYSNAERAFCLVNCAINVQVAANGQLILSGGGGASRLAPLDAADRGGGVIVHRFRNLDSGETAAFVERDGKIVRYISAGGVNRATRISLFAGADGFFAIALLGLLAALAAVISGVSRLLAPTQPSARARLVGVFLPLTGAAWLAALIGYGIYFQRASVDEWVVMADWPGEFAFGAWAGAVAAALTVLCVLAVAVAWMGANWSVWRRTRIVTTLAAFVALAVMLNAWNMLGPRF